MFNKKELEVLTKIKKECMKNESCSTCKYFSLTSRCVFNHDFAIDWEVGEDEVNQYTEEEQNIESEE